jgi:uncharacterized phage protein (TIGR01671 family)
MRNLKFRAWDKVEKIWLFGYEMPRLGGFSLIGETVLMGELSSVPLRKLCEDVVITQFTGIKDINGTEVYEGDIVNYQHSINSNRYTGEIYYRDTFGSFWLKSGEETGFALLGAQKIIKVIGNIFKTSHP